MPTIRPAAAALVLLCAPPAFAQEARELDAHVHGHAELQVAIDGDALTLALEIPGESVVGFEHAAETDEQQAAIDAAVEAMGDPLTLFTLPDAAGCTVAEAEAEHHQEGTHSAFEAEYALTCASIGALDGMETTLFETYPDLEEIDVEYATPAGQGSGELEPGEAALSLPTS